jgi:CheY-like chemotaxis protein
MATILLADDEAALASAVSRLLQREGHEVLVASDGVMALELMQQHPVDLTIVDIYMPNLDGIELTRRLRREIPDAKVIAVSGGGLAGRQDVLAIARLLGAAKTLTKPFLPEEILTAVREVLGAEPRGGAPA